MENLVFINNCEGFITKESFIQALKKVGDVILTNSKRTVMVSGLEACRRITRKKADIIFCTKEDNGEYYYIADDREYILNVLI